MGFKNINYLSLCKYSDLQLASPPFIDDFREDFINKRNEYEKSYNLLVDDKSKEIFEKIINFKMTTLLY